MLSFDSQLVWYNQTGVMKITPKAICRRKKFLYYYYDLMQFITENHTMISGRYENVSDSGSIWL